MHSIVFQVFISTWLQKRNRLQYQRGREGGQRRRNRESRRDWRAWQLSHTTSPHRYPSANFKKVDVVFEWNYGWILVHIGPSPNKVKFNATVSDHWWPLYRVPFDSSSDIKYVTLWKNVTDCPDLPMFRFNVHGHTFYLSFLARKRNFLTCKLYAEKCVYSRQNCLMTKRRKLTLKSIWYFEWYI